MKVMSRISEHRLEGLQEVLLQLGGEPVGAAHQPGVHLAHEGDPARHLQHVQRRRQGWKMTMLPNSIRMTPMAIPRKKPNCRMKSPQCSE
jgi:hypothetical protein